MLDERENMREAGVKPKWQWSATIVLLAVNVVVWLIQSWAYQFHHDFPLDDYFALSVDGLRHGYLWQLLTYQFMHAVPEPWHLLFNSWAIYVFGRVIEMTIGKARMLKLYFLSGIVGGLLQMLGSALLPGLFGTGAAVGASAGAFGLVAAFAVLYPNERLYLLLFFVIPLKMRAKTLLWLSVALAVFGILLPLFAAFLPQFLSDNILFSNVAHAAHLGGIATGFFLARRLIRQLVRRRTPPPIIETDVKTSLKITPAPD